MMTTAIANAIVEVQGYHGYTWSQMTELLGVTPSDLSQYRRGKHEPLAGVARRLYIAALGPRPDWRALQETAPLLTALLQGTGPYEDPTAKVRMRQQPAPQRLPSGGRWIPGLIPLVEDDEEELR